MDDCFPFPHFIIGGAPRSGTTFLCHALSYHPGIRIARPFIPEPKVFFGPEREARWYHERYAQLYSGADEGVVRGEKTSNYFECPIACARIGRHLPQVRMVFIVREPVARAYSNYLWTTKNGLETLSFEEAIKKEGRRESPLPPEKAHARPYDYLSRGDYATFAQRYISALGRENVAFFLYEDIEARPDAMMGELQRFLGVDPLPFAALDAGVINSAREVGPPLDPRTRGRLRERMTPYVRAFGELSGLDLSIWGY